MNTVTTRIRNTGIVLAVASALVLGFGPRAQAEPVPGPVHGPSWTFNHSDDGAPRQRLVKPLPISPARPGHPRAGAVTGAVTKPEPATERSAPVIWNGNQLLAAAELRSGRIQ